MGHDLDPRQRRVLACRPQSRRLSRAQRKTLLFEVAPPLSRGTAWIELLATGQSAEFRVKLPLHWQRY